MHINTKYRLSGLIYLVTTYPIAFLLIALFADMVINGGIIDIWRGKYSFLDLLQFRKYLYLKLAALGAIIGFFYWMFFLSRFRYHDPLDKYFK